VARLYANENFPLQVVRALRGLGHDVLTVTEAGNANQAISDEEVLAFAIRERRAVITLNRREFIVIHNHTPDHAGIIVCAQDPDTDGQALHYLIDWHLGGRLRGLPAGESKNLPKLSCNRHESD